MPETPAPTVASTTSLMPSMASNATEPGDEILDISLDYDLTLECGLDAEDVMNEVDNTLKQGLIAAQTAVAIRILNSTFPRVERNRRYVRSLAYLDGTHSHGDTVSSTSQLQDLHRKLVYYTDQYPVQISRILDLECEGLPVTSSCLLVQSNLRVVLEEGDDGAVVSEVIETGMQNSFDTGEFFGAVPADTVVC